ncbi:putative metalloprotease CJM1_0395 family protein [Thalassospira sp.]|uniref:putative metalloprotease CJM1_0395 family protein n=1 Tax=Thalassospira sp. TaxID=1912094 RepID=UPI003AA811CD
MVSTGQTITNPNGGGLGVVLNVREIAQTADGQIVAEYEAIELQRRGADSAQISPYSIAGAGSEGAHTRIVDPRTLTEAQAVAGGVTRAEYRQAREASSKEDGAYGNTSSTQDLDPVEEAVVNQLRARDSAVRQEEEAHAAAAGPYGSAPQYTYQIGPDGNVYAIGGHVDVSVSVSGSAADRDRALSTLQNAALAPNAPSGADMAAFRQASLLKSTMSSSDSTPTAKESALNGASQPNSEQKNFEITV